MTPQEAIVQLDRNFKRIAKAKARPDDPLHPDRLNEILDAIRPLCYGQAVIQRQNPRQARQQVQPLETQEEAKPCLKCLSVPCECSSGGDDGSI